ncbi:MAG TPA: endolytic transglycosylase MltG, partial [Dongiaceae bacterium]
KNPYNTYLFKGLPPGPICNPGLAAIQAVLHPTATKDLYFVANGSGGHAFAETLAQHNRNVAAYRKLIAQQAADQAPAASDIPPAMAETPPSTGSEATGGVP